MGISCKKPTAQQALVVTSPVSSPGLPPGKGRANATSTTWTTYMPKQLTSCPASVITNDPALSNYGGWKVTSAATGFSG